MSKDTDPEIATARTLETIKFHFSEAVVRAYLLSLTETEFIEIARDTYRSVIAAAAKGVAK
jgi:hypothetical protein